MQEDLVKSVVAVGKPVVAVLVNGRPLSISWLDENVSAILEAWLPGEEGAAAIAEVLFGGANPGGKLPITVPRSVGQVPIYYNHKPSGGRSFGYVDYVDSPATSLPVRTRIELYHLCVFRSANLARNSRSGETVEISLSIANREVTGDEVVQLYVCDEYASSPAR